MALQKPGCRAVSNFCLENSASWVGGSLHELRSVDVLATAAKRAPMSGIGATQVTYNNNKGPNRWGWGRGAHRSLARISSRRLGLQGEIVIVGATPCTK